MKNLSVKQKERFFRTSLLVREAGVEPARPCEHRHLKPARLPIPPLAQAVCAVSLSARRILAQSFYDVKAFLEKEKIKERSVEGNRNLLRTLQIDSSMRACYDWDNNKGVVGAVCAAWSTY